MKKLTLSVVAAGITAASIGAYAAVPTGAAPFQVVVPNLKSGVEFSLEGLYVQPSNSDLSYSIASTSSGSITNTSVSSVKPDFNFGFGVGFGYVFPNSGNDVQAKWTHFDHSTNDSTAYSPSTGTTVTNTGDSSFKYDAVDLDIGQYLSVGTRLQTRLFVGLRAARLQSDFAQTQSTASTPNVAAPLTTDGTFISNSKFTGIGPRFGIDTSYHVGDCFGVVSHFATALLVGRVETSGFTADASSARDITTTDQTRVVPAFDAKLGLDYTINFKNSTNSRMSIEAGYQLTDYVGATDNVSGGSVNGDAGNLAFHGPYLSLNFKI